MRILLSFLFTLTVFYSHAVCVSASSGNWGNPFTWLCNGSPSIPGCGDTIVISAGHTVSIVAQQDYSGCTEPMYIYIDGTLDFPNNGPKLKLPDDSYIQINSGGQITSSGGGGGSSNNISIGGSTVWQTSDGPVTGPSTFGNPPLPINLVYFNANVLDNTVQITWTTASEINNDFFTIERSTDAQHWEEILTTKGAGNSSQILNYVETDFDPLKGISYYRLKQTDFDRKFKYFNVVPVKFVKNAPLDISVYPNPISNGKTLRLVSNFDANEELLVVLRDLQGKEFYSKIHLNVSKNELIGIPIENDIPKGIYLIIASSENSIYSKKLIVK